MTCSKTTWIAAAMLCIALAPHAWGSVRVDVLSSAKEAAPGGVVTHVFAVAHDSSSAGAYGLTVTAPAGWDVLGVPAEVAIGPGEEATIFVTLAVPPDAAAGSYVLTLTASAAGDPADAASAGIATRVAALNEIELVPPSGESVSVGASASYSVLVTNRGNAQERQSP